MNKPLTILSWVAVGLVLFAGGIFVGQAYAAPYFAKQEQTKASAVAFEFVKDLTTDKAATAYASTSSELQKKQAKDVFVAGMANLKATQPTYQTAEVLRQDNRIIYTQTVTGMPPTVGSNTTGSFYIGLVKEKGAWKVATVTVQ